MPRGRVFGLRLAALDPCRVPGPLQVEVLDRSGPDPTVAEVTGGFLDQHFRPFSPRGSHRIKTTLWFRLPPAAPAAAGETPVLLVRSGMDQPVEVFARQGGTVAPLRAATVAPKFGGGQDTVFALTPPMDSDAPLYARVTRTGGTTTDLQFATSTLGEALERAAAHARMVALAARGCVRLQLQLASGNAAARDFYQRRGYRARDGYRLLDRALQPPPDAAAVQPEG